MEKIIREYYGSKSSSWNNVGSFESSTRDYAITLSRSVNETTEEGNRRKFSGKDFRVDRYQLFKTIDSRVFVFPSINAYVNITEIEVLGEIDKFKPYPQSDWGNGDSWTDEERSYSAKATLSYLPGTLMTDIEQVRGYLRNAGLEELVQNKD